MMLVGIHSPPAQIEYILGIQVRRVLGIPPSNDAAAAYRVTVCGTVVLCEGDK
jgi:hypothetical protein